ncbi:hypothetical protein ACN28S_42945 [Cystobacter fuscus]
MKAGKASNEVASRRHAPGTKRTNKPSTPTLLLGLASLELNVEPIQGDGIAGKVHHAGFLLWSIPFPPAWSAG